MSEVQDCVISGSSGNEPREDGDLVFRTPEIEFLRFKGNGAIYVKGKLVATADEGQATVAAIREWLERSVVTSPSGRAGSFSYDRKGNATFQSGRGVQGHKGGNVELVNEGEKS